ncbi:MAG: DNA polymerase III subunit beta [Bacteroidales bacterium]|nr:DNA polymerase III subunit beta [Bacteroidales bacterium]
MKFIISSSELLAYLQALNKVVPSRSIVPLVENFLFEISSDGLKITATDLETTLIARLELDNIEGEGKVAIESKRLLDILKEFSQQPLTFEINDENFEVVIKSESGKYSIPGNSHVDEFPEHAEISADIASSFVISSEILKKGINSTFFSISDDDLRPVMNGIYMELKPDGLTFVSSDSHKLVRYRRNDFTSEKEASFILAKKPADLLRNILAKLDDDVKVEFDDRNAIFELSSYTVVCRLIEGNFPDYEAVMPKNNDKMVNIDKNNFHNTIKRVSLFANEASKLVKFYFHENEAEISAQDIDFSISAFEKINCLYDQEPIKIGFKSTFLLDIMQNLDATDISLTMTDPKRAALVFPTQMEDSKEDIVMLVMPMMLDEDE